MAKYTLNMEEYISAARKTVAEGQVLVRNEKKVLPLKKGTKISVFGRIQNDYYKSGTGSGGLVNVSRVVSIMDALQEEEGLIINQELAGLYREWEKEHPFDAGMGWGTEPWCQKEMVLSEETVKTAAEASEVALVIIGRTAGEDQDNSDKKGSYRLTDEEEHMMSLVRDHFDHMVVILNVGNIMDMSFVDAYQPEAVLYAWQGGMIGGYGTVDVLTGKVNPSGKLADTIAYQISDYASDRNFGNKDADLYEEDIYVGYRYFETFAPEKVRYSFGFGLSYTEFTVKPVKFVDLENEISISVKVENMGDTAGKEVVQVYVQAPQGKLGQPVKKLVAFEKTELLMPGEAVILTFTIEKEMLASYDDAGVTGERFAYLLEEGEYIFHIGNSAKDCTAAGSFFQTEKKVISRHNQAMAPVRAFLRIRPEQKEDGTFAEIMEAVPTKDLSYIYKREEHLPETIAYTGNQGITLRDVKEGRADLKTFVAQMSDEDLSCIIRGEGMGSPKVTPGTAAAFGGVSEGLKKLGLPCVCCSDGPSGMRLDCGTKAFSLPNGTLLACTFNKKLVEELYSFTGIEMVKNHVEVLLGPGMNIHRHPLNGRNFEYFSEDPYVTGAMALAELKGLQSAGVTGCVKHFCANNQEYSRSDIDSVASERALREIYLKGYEMIVRAGLANAVMTTYGAVNGIWTAGNYDLNTVILRNEWGFKGIAMTDWWAKINREGHAPSMTDFAQMACAQNDLYMVCQDAAVNSNGDNTLEELKSGFLSRGELQRNAMNICEFLMNTQAYARFYQEDASVEVIGSEEEEDIDMSSLVYYRVEDEAHIDLSDICTEKGSNYLFAFDLKVNGRYEFALTARSDASELAQMPVTLINQGIPAHMFTFNGTGGEWKTMSTEITYYDKYPVQRLYFGQSGLELKEITITYKGGLVRS